ncbi:Synapse-associated protein 1 [Sorochytrium milnesiophthora]
MFSSSGWATWKGAVLQKANEAQAELSKRAEVLNQRLVDTINSDDTKEKLADFQTVATLALANARTAAAKLKDTAEAKLTEWEQQQSHFIEAKRNGEDGGSSSTATTNTASLPWIGAPQEEHVKAHILQLSKDKDSLLSELPVDAKFEFSMAASLPQAMALLEADHRLEDVRFRLVPRRLKEEVFWRHYFYQVSLILDAARQGALDALPPSPVHSSPPDLVSSLDAPFQAQQSYDSGDEGNLEPELLFESDAIHEDMAASTLASADVSDAEDATEPSQSPNPPQPEATQQPRSATTDMVGSADSETHDVEDDVDALEEQLMAQLNDLQAEGKGDGDDDDDDNGAFQGDVDELLEHMDEHIKSDGGQ